MQIKEIDPNEIREILKTIDSDETILLSARVNHIENQWKLGLIDKDTYQLNLRQINRAAVELSDKKSH